MNSIANSYNVAQKGIYEAQSRQPVYHSTMVPLKSIDYDLLTDTKTDTLGQKDGYSVQAKPKEQKPYAMGLTTTPLMYGTPSKKTSIDIETKSEEPIKLSDLETITINDNYTPAISQKTVEPHEYKAPEKEETTVFNYETQPETKSEKKDLMEKIKSEMTPEMIPTPEVKKNDKESLAEKIRNELGEMMIEQTV